jgi:phthiocerol/phenolphthiocerol synthesis type-I polyketide synthase E
VSYIAPRNELERAITGVWQDVLGIDGPGINDSFVALGGHSLLGLQLVTRIRELLEIEITVANLYQAATVAGLAELIVRQLAESMDAETLEEIIRGLDAAIQEQEVS